ncbi:MAG: aldose epimerase family protein [Pseudomonadota bacterium]
MAEIIARLPDGRPMRRVSLSNGTLTAEVIDHGARLHAIRLNGGPNMTAAPEDPTLYETTYLPFGTVMAPVINRISGAQAELDGTLYRFEANIDGRFTLHSGAAGTQHAIWSITDERADSVILSVDLPDGHGGFPGNRRVTTRYALDGATLMIEVTATTDAPTFMNPAHHGYWSLDGAQTWEGHVLEVYTDTYLPCDADDIPTGDIAPVAGSPYDHRTARAPDPTLDNNFCFTPTFGPRCRLTSPEGRHLDVHSDAPGLQVYVGDPRGIALEPQLWPNAPHNPTFPCIRLDPGQTLRQRSHFTFSA